ncbi:prolyl endopeptidase-like [Gigantopelta aegis]|uniref:prolyl endopeptidase-like n=1 Tax=Gigantopelta aegis TaxID=1735272 RepID=UPI001B888CF3|nr:prolyl endopeptidase-like [Gigantopelta aegis]
MVKFHYPNARRDESVSEDFHGTKVVDAYRWLEDPDAEETKEFVDKQNELSRPFLDACPIKEKLKNRITELWDYPKYSCPGRHGDYFYYYYNTGLQNQSVLYVQKGLDAKPSVFLDPNELSPDGTISICGTAFSENEEMFAYSLSSSGSDWVEIKFKKSPSGDDLPDKLEKVKFTSIAWTHDHKGIFYNRYPEEEGKQDGTETTSNLHHKLYYHRIGTAQTDDVLVAEFTDNPKWMIGAEVSDCGRYLILSIRESCKPVNQLFYVDLESLPKGINGLLSYVTVVDNFDAEYEYIANNGTVFTFKTNLDAPLYKLITIDFADPDKSKWKTVVPEDKTSVLEWAAVVNDNKLILCYLKDVKNELFVHDLVTGERKSQLRLDVGSVVGYSGKRKHKEIFYKFMSFLTPGIIYRCDMTSDTYESKVFREIHVKDFDIGQFETKQVFYTSKDDTKVPMFIVQRKDLQLNGSHPVMLYGYGGFNISLTPSFSPSRLVFLQHLGGVYALPNIRGGGEYGETWHKGGCLANKQNCFDDFQRAAEYLIENKYTSPSKIIINGGSNGGLLVGACINQRPDLFGCAIAQVGVLDMMRFHKFTIGHAWTSDYGCSDKPEEFQWQIKYSPLHNVKEKDSQYPAVLLLTGDHDDRVVPLHSLKFMAELQHVLGKSKTQTNPLMLRVDTKAGHGAGKPTAKIIEELTDIYSFIYQTVGLEWKDKL